MTNPSKLIELAASCETSEPNRKLDLAIGEAVGTWPAKPNTFKFPKRYSGSLDAAMTLVPEGSLYGIGNPDGKCHAMVSSDPDALAEPVNAATPALALCAAALRAQAAKEG